ncbi:MAG: SRPBCC family protein [Anaerolineae bacterium]|nr:SRPBCC family protein [Anaerolineae bacterium]MDW8298679.1 SRPBCC family protein [Anaerolineae bacterium]
MQHISESISIHATPAAVWSLLTTPDHILKWFVGIESVQASPDYPAVGSTISGSYKVMGIELKAVQTVQVSEPNSRIHYTLEGIVTGTQRWEIAQSGDGVTLSMTMDYSMSGGVLGKLAEPAVHQVNLNNAKQSLANIKAMAER